jgi:protein-disulfide isomerase
VRLVFKDFPLSFHTLAHTAHQAARCAGAAGQYWPYHDRLFQSQPRFERERLVAYAVELGIDRARFERCLDDRQFAAAVDEDILQGRALGVSGTPAFLINGRLLVGAQPVESFRAVIDQVLQRR